MPWGLLGRELMNEAEFVSMTGVQSRGPKGMDGAGHLYDQPHDSWKAKTDVENYQLD